MIIKILQTISNTLSEDRKLESSYTSECYTLQAEKGKILKNIRTGLTTNSVVCVNKKEKIENYIEIDDLEELTA